MNNLEKIKTQILNCKDCNLSDTRQNPVPGEGYTNPRFMFIAQAPGEQEDIHGKMFVGSTGNVFDKILNAINLTRKDIYMTNLIKCTLPKCRNPHEEEITACSKHLNAEINTVNPEFIITMGKYATRYIFNKYNIDAYTNEGFSSVCGRLFFSEGMKVFPLPHPSTVVYQPETEAGLLELYKRIIILKTTCKWFPVCPMRRLYESGRIEKKWIELYCRGYWMSCTRYQMEENGKYHSDNMLPDGHIEKTL